MNKRWLKFFALLTLVISICGCAESNKEELIPQTTETETQMSIHFLDVGQGDATLIIVGDQAMLIDAGDNNQGTKIQNYLTKQGVERLNYVIGTHPDSDHIGGLDVILYKFDCDTIIMPTIEKDTQTYEEVIDTMKEKGYQNTIPIVGETFTLGNAEFTILGPMKEYEDTNNNSIAIQITHGENKFIFTGDGEEEAEESLLQGQIDLNARVYKVGHHGSSSSSSRELLEAISPDYAVISCEEGNTYGHPHAEVLNHLRELEIQVFRTDEQGTVIVTSDGKELIWNCSPTDTWKAGEATQSAPTEMVMEAEPLPEEPVEQVSDGIKEETREEITYICNTNTGKFHKPGCSSVDKMKDANKLEVTLTREEVVQQGYDACGNCHP